MKKIILLLLFFQCCIYHGLIAQMWSETQNDTLYGNEWINFDVADQYYKIKVAEDGLYRINQETLINSNIPVETIEGDQYQLFRMGEEVPIHVSSVNEALSNGDYITFYGQKNRSDLDKHLFKNPETELLNPAYSIFTDTAVYFLTWTEVGEGLRYEDVDNDLSGNLPDKEAWFMEETLLDYHDSFFKKYEKISNIDVYYSNFDVAEGFATGRSSNRTVMTTASHIHPSATNADLSIRLATNIGVHQLQIEVDGENYIDSSFNEVRLLDFDLTVPISASDPELEVVIKGLEGSADQHVLSNISLNYPRQFNFDGQNAFIFSLPASITDKYLEIENFDTGISNPILYDISNQIRIETTVGEGLVKVLLPPSMTERQLILLNPESAIRNIDALEQTVFEDYTTSDYEDTDYVLLSHSAFFDDGQGNNLVQEYADYRSSAQGGGYETAIIDIEQLYEQFGYGVYGHAISVRNFAHYIKKNWEAPHYFFIVGKGREYRDMRTSTQFEAADKETFFVPTFGWPGSDNLLFSDNYSSVPVFSMGRLSCRNTAELGIYLDKVKALEANVNAPQTIEDRAWMKHVIHLSGGGGGNEQPLLRSHLDAIADTLEQTKMGAKVFSFYKTNTDPIQVSNSERIFEEMTKGLSLITFFGHSSPSVLDFDIDNPERYDNYGKYPLFLGLGCSAGNFFTANNSISERFTFYKDKGTIGFGATRGFGFVSALRTFTEEFYELFGGEMYGQGIGDVLKETFEVFDESNWIGMRTLVQQFTFQADPAIRLHPAPGPDYIIEKTSVNFEPNVVSLNRDSFKLSFDIVNIGLAVSETMTIEIVQELPNGTRQTMIRDSLIAAPFYSNTLTYNIPTLGRPSVGLNKFFIQIDAKEEIVELPSPMAEMNNNLINASGELGVDLFIVDDSALPLYPPKYGIIGKNDVTLIASTSNALAPERKYIIELDTTALFNSLFRKRTEIVQKGGLVKWQPNLTYQEEEVYYWRISPDSTDADIGFLWEQSSFTFIEGQTGGWSQGDYYQFLEDEFDRMVLNEETQGFQFINKIRDIWLKNKVWDANDPPKYIRNGQLLNSPWPWLITEGVQIMILDSLTLERYKPEEAGQFGSFSNNGTSPWLYKTDTPENRVNLMNFIKNEIPPNHFAIFWTVQRTMESDLYTEEWAADSIEFGENIFGVLEAEGATLIRELETKGSVPYVFMFQKGKGMIKEGLANFINETINVEHGFPERWKEGTLKSVKIGPATRWHEFQTDAFFTNLTEHDSINLNIKGIDTNSGEESILMTLEPEESATVSLADIDASQYQFLRLEYYAHDEVGRRPISLDYWRVLFDGIPEVAVNPHANFVFYADSLEQGEILKIDYAIENISDYDMDSLLIKYLINNNVGANEVYYQTISPLARFEGTAAAYSLETKDKTKNYTIIVEVNPADDQAEVYHGNNFMIKDFFVKKDKRNPLVDVTFDGIHIFDGDIISPTPEIFVQIKDENQFLGLSDTALFELFLQYPNESTPRTISYADEDINFVAATGNLADKNEASIAYRPTLTVDGVYELIVKARDVAGNVSGDLDYRIKFEVINKKMISNVFNYPNPFSTATQFVYTLTGNELPDYFKIRIMTMSGNIVKEINQTEIGELRIGTHRTDYTWDGTDEYGDQLANGVYLYQVFTKNAAGEDYEQYDTETRQFFKGDFGKLVILR